MPDNRNYQKELDILLAGLRERNLRPDLLLHGCCAPCSSYTLEYLSEYFDITELFYNPNISPQEEYDFRASELARFISEKPFHDGKLSDVVKLVICDYDPEEFERLIKGHEKEPERGSRCTLCYRLRLEKAAEYASEHSFDYFCTTLSISPYKDAVRLMSIGEDLAEKYGVKYLPGDFKKKNGYKRSIELSSEYGLYRQDYCGCIYSKR